MSTNIDDTSSANAERLTGRVKWFNNKAGYGFITVTYGEYANVDVFIHHSAINVSNKQYKYLVQGEYVDFNLITLESDKYKFHAGNINGVNGGKLMCETRYDLKLSQSNYKKEHTFNNEKTQSVNTTNSRKTTTQIQTELSIDPQTQAQAQAQSQTPKTPRIATRIRIRGEGPREESKEWTVVSKKAPAPKKKQTKEVSVSE